MLWIALIGMTIVAAGSLLLNLVLVAKVATYKSWYQPTRGLRDSTEGFDMESQATGRRVAG